MSRERLFKILPWISTPALLLILFTVWEVSVNLLGISELILPPPSAIFEALAVLMQDPNIWNHIRMTITEIIIGFGAGVLLGSLVGVILGKFPIMEVMLRPMIIALQVIPKVALIPLFVIWFGFGMTSKVIIAAVLAFFPVMLNVLLGVRSVDPGQRDVMRSLNSSKWQTFVHLELKSTLPNVFAGMESAIVLAVIGAIVGEYLGGNEGLGYLIVRTLNQLNAPGLFAVILLLSALGLAMYFGVTFLKRLVIPWHESVYGLKNAG